MPLVRPFAGRSFVTAALASAAMALSACATEDLVVPQEIPIEQQTWAASLGVTLSQFTRLATGTYYLDQAVGTGTTVSGTPNVAVQYAGYLPNGNKFDERTATQGSICFPLSGLIPGWRDGLQGMRVQGRRRLLIPASQGYGSNANGPIPANSNLLFDITLTGTGCTP